MLIFPDGFQSGSTTRTPALTRSRTHFSTCSLQMTRQFTIRIRHIQRCERLSLHRRRLEGEGFSRLIRRAATETKNFSCFSSPIRRRQKLHPQKQRSKYICKPEAVIEAGNHFVWEFCPGRGSLNVPANSAILHREYIKTMESRIVFHSNFSHCN